VSCCVTSQGVGNGTLPTGHVRLMVYGIRKCTSSSHVVNHVVVTDYITKTIPGWVRLYHN